MLLTFTVFSSSVLAEEEQHFSFSVAYTNLSLDGDEFADDFDGWGMAFRWRAKFLEELPNLLIGASFQLGFYQGNDTPTDNPFDSPALNESINDVDIFSPTLDLAWRIPLGSQFFVEPGIGVGWAWGTYNPVIEGANQETNSGLVVRPGVMLGYENDQWSTGLDFQYSVYWIDFSTDAGATTVSDLDGSHDELYIGIFVRYSF
jgi:hypothetical protein